MDCAEEGGGGPEGVFVALVDGGGELLLEFGGPVTPVREDRAGDLGRVGEVGVVEECYGYDDVF